MTAKRKGKAAPPRFGVPAIDKALDNDEAFSARLVEVYGPAGRRVQRYWPTERHTDKKLLALIREAEALRPAMLKASRDLVTGANPPARRRARANPPRVLMSRDVLRIEYVHVGDGKRYYHDFRSGVKMVAVGDRLIELVRQDGKPLSAEFA